MSYSWFCLRFSSFWAFEILLQFIFKLISLKLYITSQGSLIPRTEVLGESSSPPSGEPPSDDDLGEEDDDDEEAAKKNPLYSPRKRRYLLSKSTIIKGCEERIGIKVCCFKGCGKAINDDISNHFKTHYPGKRRTVTCCFCGHGCPKDTIYKHASECSRRTCCNICDFCDADDHDELIQHYRLHHRNGNKNFCRHCGKESNMPRSWDWMVIWKPIWRIIEFEQNFHVN